MLTRSEIETKLRNLERRICCVSSNTTVFSQEIIDALNEANLPDGLNPFATIDDLPVMPDLSWLTEDIKDGLTNANSPTELNPYATISDLAFISPGTTITVVPNYGALPDPTTVSGEFYWTEAAQGTYWLPGALGGTYFPAGIYYSNGVIWTFIQTPFQATQVEVDAGLNNDRFVTPLTLENSDQWDTKSDIGHTHTGLLTAEDTQFLYNLGSTGVTKFDGFSINADTTKYDTGLVEGWFVDNTTDPNNPTKVFRSFPATTAYTLTNLATQNVTYIAIDINGVHHQSGTPFEPEQQRDWIPLGAIIHSNRINVNAINNQPVVAISPNAQLSDLMESIGFFNIYGNVFLPNGANLNINKTAGHVFKQGANFINDNQDPHTLFLPALVAPTNIRYRLSDGTEYANTSVIDPDFYELAGVKTAVPGGKFQIQRIYLFQSNLVRIQYGQEVYGSMALAIQSIITEPFIIEQNILENGLLRGLLIVKQAATDLTDTSRALFIEAGKFGGVTGLGTLSTTSLQNAYDNSIVPEIITNSTLGAVSIRRGSALDTDNVLEVQNGAGTNTASINGNGQIVGTILGLNVPSPTATIDLQGPTLTGTSATRAIDIKQTWNTSGNPALIHANVTRTVSGLASKLIDLKVNNVSFFNVDDALGKATAKFGFWGPYFGNAAATATFLEFATHTYNFYVNGIKKLFIDSTGLTVSTTNAVAKQASALLEMQSTTQGFLPPKMTVLQRDAISIPATGLTIFCTDAIATDSSTGVTQTYNGTVWKNHW